jgi:hypothetical protein
MNCSKRTLRSDGRALRGASPPPARGARQFRAVQTRVRAALNAAALGQAAPMPLPAGWRTKISRSSGATYFVSAERSQYKLPTVRRGFSVARHGLEQLGAVWS